MENPDIQIYFVDIHGKRRHLRCPQRKQFSFISKPIQLTVEYDFNTYVTTHASLSHTPTINKGWRKWKDG